jgi:hypothetical protein
VTIPEPPVSRRRAARSVVAVLATCLCWPSLPARALVLPDPSGSYEGQCTTGVPNFPESCDSQPTPRPLRSKAHLFAVAFDPGDCSTIPCNPPPTTTIEGQVISSRSYVQNVWNEATQSCKPASDPGFTYVADVFDVSGTVTWTNLQTGANQLSLSGQLVSDPGPATYVPAMSYTGTFLPRERASAPSVIEGCIELVGTPGMQMVGSFAAPVVEATPGACAASTGFPSSHCWRRLSGPLPIASGAVRGTLVSLAPTYTETDNEVHQATIVLYEQTRGRVRDQLPDESDDDYAEHLRTSGRKEVRRLQIERTRDGTYSFGEPGRFEIPDVPTFRFRSESDGRWGTVWYTIEVEGAETDERIPLEGGGTVAGRLLFRSGRAVNVRPEEAPLAIGLDALGEIGVKRQLIERLSQMCVLHYAPAEEAATTFLDAAGDGDLSEEVAEAIQRGAWAERAVLGSRALAEELIEVSLAGLGTLLGDLYDDMNGFHRADIAHMRNSRERLSSPANPLSADSFKLDAGDLKLTTRHAVSGSGSSQLLAQSDLASTVKKAIKGLRPLLVLGLEQAGAADPDGTAGTIVTAVEVLADGIETRTKAGAGKAIVKLIIAEAIAQSKPVLLDVSPLSYCGLTDEHLATSAAQMSLWGQSDEATYLKDRREVVARIARINSEASNILGRMRAAQEVAAGFDTVQDAAEVIGTVFKWVKVLEEFAKVTKYVLNGESVVLPFRQAYGVMPGQVEGAVAAAYANGFPVQLVATEPASSELSVSGDEDGSAPSDAEPGGRSSSRSAVAVSVSVLDTVLMQMDEALAEDRIGDLLDIVGDVDAASYVIEREKHERAVQALFAQAGAASGAYSLQSALRDASRDWNALQTVHADLSDTLRGLFGDTRSGTYQRTSDAGYVRARGLARALIGVTRTRLAALAARTEELRAVVDSNGFGPAVLLEARPPLSTVTNEALISSSPETFTLPVRVVNLGSTPLAGLSLRAIAESPSDSVAVQGAVDRPAGSGMLAAFDGLDNGGADEAVVHWPLQYSGDLHWEIVTVGAKLLQNGSDPVGIFAADSTRILPFDAAQADQDGDAMPDDYELDFGLNPAADDARLDLDDDGLANLAELRLGTDPSLPDTDGDGAVDGDEVLPPAHGFVTDPLTADTDGDGTDDAEDGAPLDAASTTAPVAAGEPVVELSRSLVLLTSESSAAALTVSNSGSGVLLWSARTEHETLLQLGPRTGEVGTEDGLLFIAMQDGVDFSAIEALVATVAVTDAAGTVQDSRKVTVVFGSNPGAAVCGHGSEATIGSSLKANDALVTLRAAVGTAPCPDCRCDVDDSGDVTAGDALRVLRAAVGIPVALNCPACSP